MDGRAFGAVAQAEEPKGLIDKFWSQHLPIITLESASLGPCRRAGFLRHRTKMEASAYC